MVNLFRYLLLTGLAVLPIFGDTANTFVYNGTPTSTAYNEDVSASFIVSGGNLLVTVSSTTPNVTYDMQILTGVLFTYSGAGSVTGTVTNPTAQGYSINDSTGNLTTSGTPASAKWHTEVGDLAGYVTLTNLNNGNGAGSYGIISTSTNSAGTNNLAKHGPFLEGPLQFSIANLTGLTSSSQITSVEFNFGTETGSYSPAVTGVLTATPEPSGFLLLGIGLVGISWMAKKRSLKA